jgi:3-methyladenine DNA glycosylase AlkD
MYSFLLTYINSKKEFEVRFVIIMFLDYYLVDEYVDLVLEAISNIKQNDYYVKMALAWLLSICYIKYKEKTLHFLSLSCLDDWTYQKTLQKIMESNQVPLSEKEKIRRMKKARKEGIECQKI